MTEEDVPHHPNPTFLNFFQNVSESASSDDIEDDAPLHAGELLGVEVLEPDPIIVAVPTALVRANLRVEIKNYALYQRIKFYGWIESTDGVARPAKGLKLNMYTGQGWFDKSKRDSPDITFIEEKYASFIQSSTVRATLTVVFEDGWDPWVVQYP